MRARTLSTGLFAIMLSAFAGACTASPDDTCNVDLDEGQIDARLCEATELISQCLTDAGYDVDNATDEALAEQIGECEADYRFCAALPETEDMVSSWAFDEIRGNTDKCGL